MLRKIRNQSKGAVAVEFALVMPILVFVAIVLVDFGRIAYIQISLNSAVHEGVRASSFGSSTTDVTTVVRNAAPGVAQMSQLSATPDIAVTVNSACSASVDGENTSVTASIAFDWITPVELAKYILSTSTFGTNTTIRATGVSICIF